MSSCRSTAIEFYAYWHPDRKLSAQEAMERSRTFIHELQSLSTLFEPWMVMIFGPEKIYPSLPTFFDENLHSLSQEAVTALLLAVSPSDVAGYEALLMDAFREESYRFQNADPSDKTLRPETTASTGFSAVLKAMRPGDDDRDVPSVSFRIGAYQKLYPNSVRVEIPSKMAEFCDIDGLSKILFERIVTFWQPHYATVTCAALCSALWELEETSPYPTFGVLNYFADNRAMEIGRRSGRLEAAPYNGVYVTLPVAWPWHLNAENLKPALDIFSNSGLIDIKQIGGRKSRLDDG